MAKRPVDEDWAGIPHTPGTKTFEVPVVHPTTGETHTIHVPADHDGSRIKVGFPEVRDEDGNVVVEAVDGYTDGFDPTERALAGERPVVPCGNCGTPQVLTQETFVCSACGKRNRIALKTDADAGSGDEQVATEPTG